MSTMKLAIVLFSAGALSLLAMLCWRQIVTRVPKGVGASTLVLSPGEPSSADPIQFDTLNHHIAFRSVTGSLVSQFKIGGYTPQIAESWTVAEDKLSWRFKIRNGMRFENGESITAQHVLQSWTRLGYLLKQKKSKSELFDNLEGVESLNSPTAEVPGLQVIGGDVVIGLKRAVPKLLETVSFGMYAIVHPRDFDSVTGDWLDPRKVTAAGAYRILDWNSDHLDLGLRSDYPHSLTHNSPIRKIHLTWNPEDRTTADLVVSDSSDRTLPSSLVFNGSIPSGIAFARCLNWKQSNSICASVERRRAIREVVYNALRASGAQPVRSFFPLSMKGIREVAADKVQDKHSELSNFEKIRIYFRRKSGNAFFDAIRAGIPAAGATESLKTEEVNWTASQFMESLDPDLKSYDADVAVTLTGILVEDPESDIRFMFQSKEGIRLPDTNGEILKEISRPDFSFQRINQLLWDQAVIFPIGHFAFGTWARPGYDLSQLNTVQPPIEFQWIGSTR